MDIRNSFMDIQNSFTDIQNSFTDIRNSFMDIQNSFTDIVIGCSYFYKRFLGKASYMLSIGLQSKLEVFKFLVIQQ